MRRLALATVCCYLASAGAAAALDAPGVQQRIVPDQAIGKVRLGMTLAQVKQALGPPEAVIARERRSFTRTWVEYSWSFTTWRVAFEVYRGTARAVSIRSSARAERTKEGVGFGTDAARVQRLYRTRCKPAYGEQQGAATVPLGYACVVRRTFFIANALCGNVPTAGSCASKDRRWAVIEFGVLAPGEQAPFRIVDFDGYWKPIP